MDIKLHHYAYRIKPDSFEKVSELFEQLGCKLDHRNGNERWGLFKEKDSDKII